MLFENMRLPLALFAALVVSPLNAEPQSLSVREHEAISQAAVALTFAHGCATFIRAPFLVHDGLRLLTSAYSTAGMLDPFQLANDAYWRVITTIEEGHFGIDGIFDTDACRHVENFISEAVRALPLEE